MDLRNCPECGEQAPRYARSCGSCAHRYSRRAPILISPTFIAEDKSIPTSSIEGKYVRQSEQEPAWIGQFWGCIMVSQVVIALFMAAGWLLGKMFDLL